MPASARKKRALPRSAMIAIMSADQLNIRPAPKVGTLAQPLHRVHHVGVLHQDGVAKLPGPVGVARHHVQHGGKWQKREYAGVPGQVVSWMAAYKASPWR